MDYLTEVKFRNQLRRDLKGVASVATKADRYAKGYAHVESTFDSPTWFRVWFYDAGWQSHAGRALLIAQTLHAAGYEVKIVEQRKMFGEGTERIALYRKAEK